MSKFSALFHSDWVAGTAKDIIVGRWAEDDSRYELIVPYQLRDIIIELQNLLGSKYRGLEAAKKKVRQLEQSLKGFLE